MSWKGDALVIAYLEGIEAEAIALVGARDTGKGLWWGMHEDVDWRRLRCIWCFLGVYGVWGGLCEGGGQDAFMAMREGRDT